MVNLQISFVCSLIYPYQSSLLEGFSICYSGTGIRSSENASYAIFQLIDRKAFFFPFFILLFFFFLQEHTNLFIFIWKKNIHSFYQSIQWATTCILTVPSHTKCLSFSFNIAQWLHAGLFSPATAAIPLLLNCCHILLFRKEWTACVWYVKSDNGWGTLLNLSTRFLQIPGNESCLWSLEYEWMKLQLLSLN